MYALALFPDFAHPNSNIISVIVCAALVFSVIMIIIILAIFMSRKKQKGLQGKKMPSLNTFPNCSYL